MPLPAQPSFEDLGTPLHAVTFVVVDLETTGGSPHDCRITEFGAVKTCGGEILGEFASLVDPGQPIPPAISALTGITNDMVAVRPPVEAVLPTFLEFCRGTALVAHNAGFDTGFLNAGLERLAYPRLTNPVLCTAALARRLVRDEVRDCKLATLAHRFACRNQPTHRALADARATVEVFHALLERVGSFGVVTLEDLVAFSRVRNAPLFASRRHLADGLPSQPGVYAFMSASGEVLYVGKASDLRSRVRAYFGNDDRRKVVDMMKETDRVDHWVCPTPLEAAVREVRLIAEHRPRFNRRSKHPQRGAYVKLTKDRFPRLSLVRTVGPNDVYLGPLTSSRTAETVADAITEVVPLRRCTMRIPQGAILPSCVLAQLGRCLSPCDASVTPERYADAVNLVVAALTADPRPLLRRLEERMRHLAGVERFEEAASARDRLRALAAAIDRTRRLALLAGAGRIVASRPTRSGNLEAIVADSGRLVATARCPPAEVGATVERLSAIDTELPAEPGPVGLGEAEEIDLISGWLAGRGVRLHDADVPLALPMAGGRTLANVLAQVATATRSTGRPEAELAAKRTRRTPAPAPVPELLVAR